MACVVMIALCYIIVNVAAAGSGALVGSSNKAQMKRTKRMQHKIGIMIATDILTWVPFMFVCFIHFLWILDTSGWYSIFSIIFLPINSVINPCLILESVIRRKCSDYWKGKKVAEYKENRINLPQVETTMQGVEDSAEP